MSITQSRPSARITRRWNLKSTVALPARPSTAARAQTALRPVVTTPRAGEGWVFDTSANPGDGLGWPLIRTAA